SFSGSRSGRTPRSGVDRRERLTFVPGHRWDRAPTARWLEAFERRYGDAKEQLTVADPVAYRWPNALQCVSYGDGCVVEPVGAQIIACMQRPSPAGTGGIHIGVYGGAGVQPVEIEWRAADGSVKPE